MRKMKDSGIAWIGEIPAEWSLTKGKYLFRQRNEKGNRIELQLLSPTQKFGVIPQEMYENLSGMKAVKLDESTDYSVLKSIYKGDFCISLRSFQGGFEYSKYNGVVSPAYQVFYKIANLYDSYYRYMFKDQSFISKMTSYTKTFRDGKSISFTDFGASLIPVPPVTEQHTIAAFLDDKCSHIDSIIEKTRASIDEYKKLKQAVITRAVTKGIRQGRKMKDSGIDWIGEIPKDWAVKKLGAITKSMRNGYVGPTKNILVSDGIRYIQSLHIKDGRIIFDNHPYYVSEEWANKHPKIQTNDILIVQTGDIGNVGLVSPTFDKCNCHALIIATPDTAFIIPQYLTYYLLSHVGRELLLFHKTGALLPHLNSGKIKFAQICVPPLPEQQEIASYLDAKIAAIDRLIAKKEQLVAEMESCKKSLIYEVVTGKREVPIELSHKIQ
ncbi:MAG: restriction endonuclease subunit S [Acetatifactor sp.]|nr:restriction endonuclease subunit S [Acetatifactor sp.]